MKRRRFSAYTGLSPYQRGVVAMRAPWWRGKLALAAAVFAAAAIVLAMGMHQTSSAQASIVLTPVSRTSVPMPAASVQGDATAAVVKTPDPTSQAAPPPPLTPAPTACSNNTLAQNVIISISKRHLWGCEAGRQVYESAVVTGMENLAADLTPTGTYHISGKQTNLYLKGSDSTGSWNDFVNYWMPFLNNQYGTYGFHDATWRADSDFGNIDPYSSNASHGCVELPLATTAWLYNWASIGTTVTIQS
jgi:lipoprotein-anchoring transpeptidase ErfK/SrfK